MVFSVSALLPLVAFAGFSLVQVSGQLERDAYSQLHEASKTIGMSILDRLSAHELALAALPLPPPGKELDSSPEPFLSVWRAPVDAEAVSMSDPRARLLPRNEVERRHLASGRSVLRVMPASEAEGRARLFLVRSAPDAGPSPPLVAEMVPDALWRSDAFPGGVQVVLRDVSGPLLFASTPAAARLPTGESNDRLSLEGEEHVRGAWTLFLESMYAAPAWSIEQLRPESDVLEPLVKFRQAFAPVALLAGLMVLFLSSGLIRRSLVPIDAMRKATEALAEGDFSVRVQIDTDDEFRNLGDTFNDMASRIQDLTANLEAKVRARTRELQETLDELRRTQAQLVHQEKMASLGQFVAGIAHEMNNPLAFVEGNLHFLRQYTETLVDALSAYEQGVDGAEPGLQQKMAKVREELEISDLLDDLGSTFEGCADGIQRATKLVEDLRTFSRLDDGDCVEVELNESIESTLNVLSSRLEGIEVVRDLGDLPLVECLGAQINQVFVNLLSNAADAVGGSGRIGVRTQVDESGSVVVDVEDDGCGMEPDVIARAFEPFYTTKDVGGGSGLGLSVSYGIVERHGGRIDVESTPGRGTRFRVTLPVRHQPIAAPEDGRDTGEALGGEGHE